MLARTVENRFFLPGSVMDVYISVEVGPNFNSLNYEKYIQYFFVFLCSLHYLCLSSVDV